MRALVLVALMLVPLAACNVQRWPVRYRVGGAVVLEDDRIVFPLVRSREGRDDDAFVLDCPRGAFDGAFAQCAWHPLHARAAGERPPAPPDDRASAVTRAASDHQCAAEQISVLAAHAEGFWLVVCGTQRFYRRGGGTFTETPSETQ